MNKKQTTAAQREADRARIREADPIGFMISLMKGEPQPELDQDGNVLGWVRPDLALRAAAGERLLKRVSPELSRVEVDAEGSAGVTLQVVSPFALPGSARPGAGGGGDAPPAIENAAPVDVTPVEVTPDPAPAPKAETQAGGKRRRRRRTVRFDD